jgi:hypothetical protein
MRGERISPAMKKLDLVIVAARYEAGNGKLALARGFERRGDVWTDLLLIGRKDLLARIKAGRKVAVGQQKDLPGDFAVFGALELCRRNGAESVVLAGRAAEKDELGVPLF